MPMNKDNRTMKIQRDAGSKAQTGILVFWGLGLVQAVLGLFFLRFLLASFFPVLAVSQFTGLFDADRAELYTLVYPNLNLGYVSEVYVGAILTAVGILVTLTILGALAGINTKSSKTGEITKETAKNYFEIAVGSGIWSVIILFLVRVFS